MRKTLKFGGTSVGSAEAMKIVASIIQDEQAQITVLSAMSGTTDALIAVTNDKLEQILPLEQKYRLCIDELLKDTTAALIALDSCFDIIKNSKNLYKIIAQGEILTTTIFTLYLKELGMNAELISAPDFVHLDGNGRVTIDTLIFRDDTYYVTQGFICSDENGQIKNLGRGGSDYSAALIGVATECSEVQIWTDIDGMHTGDPRYVEGTHPIAELSFSQAAEMAYFGAKILHPSTILPCRDAGIDVLLKNTMNPSSKGTRITHRENEIKFLAAALKDKITLIRITSDRMLLAYGFLRRVFDVFERHQTSIDMITTSEVAVSLTIDDTHALNAITNELSEYGHIEVETSNAIICVVGNMAFEKNGVVAQVLEKMQDIPVKMISYGASQRSISLLVDSKYKTEVLQSVNSLF